MISDDLSHWSDIFTWRQHHYQFIVSQYDAQAQSDPVISPNDRLSYHNTFQPEFLQQKILQ